MKTEDAREGECDLTESRIRLEMTTDWIFALP